MPQRISKDTATSVFRAASQLLKGSSASVTAEASGLNGASKSERNSASATPKGPKASCRQAARRSRPSKEAGKAGAPRGSDS